MINEDQALDIARAEMQAEIKAGGMPTLYGYGDHWFASCTYRDGVIPAGVTPMRIRIARADGSVLR
jgi:hypothetical protein